MLNKTMKLVYFEDGLKARPAILTPIRSISSEWVLLSSELFNEYWYSHSMSRSGSSSTTNNSWKFSTMKSDIQILKLLFTDSFFRWFLFRWDRTAASSSKHNPSDSGLERVADSIRSGNHKKKTISCRYLTHKINCLITAKPPRPKLT